MTPSGGKEVAMSSKGPWVPDKVVGSIINTEKGVKITNGMTLGGGKEATMLRKGPLGVRSIIRSAINTGKRNDDY
jgi:hypothetical protein